VLSAVQRAVERQERLIALTAELKKALMHKLFTEGTRGEPLKQTEIGPVPESWTIALIRELCDQVSGGTPSKANPSFWNGTIPWASPKDMKLPRLADTQDHVSQVGVDEGSRLVPPGSIFVVIRGMILMRDVPIAQAMVPMAFNQDMKALINFRGMTSDFMLCSLQNARDRLLRKVGSSAHGTRTLMTSAIEQLPVAVPARAEQELISRALRVLEDKSGNHDRTRCSLQALFRTLLHQLMTAQVRVHDLDLCALETAGPAGVA
jgi:type I restriction enzyme S subunit